MTRNDASSDGLPGFQPARVGCQEGCSQLLGLYLGLRLRLTTRHGCDWAPDGEQEIKLDGIHGLLVCK